MPFRNRLGGDVNRHIRSFRRPSSAYRAGRVQRRVFAARFQRRNIVRAPFRAWRNYTRSMRS